MILRKLRAAIPTPAFPGVLFSSSHKPALSSTAWIDGVRGMAALVVTLNHMLYTEIGPLFHGFRASPAATNASILQLPPFHLLFAMHAMVPLFFVISGYCLSLSPIRRRHDAPQLLAALSSAVFRRATRLFLPVLAVALLSQLLLYARAYSWGWWDNAAAWDVATFVGGLLVAEVLHGGRGGPERTKDEGSGLIASHHQREGAEGRGNGVARRRVAAVLLWVVGVYFLCVPDADEEGKFGPVYDGVLGALTPGSWAEGESTMWCWWSVGGVAFVAGLGAEPVLRRPFETRVAQYFGRISFMLYVVHQLVIRTVSRRLRVLVEVFVSWRREGLVTFFTASGSLVLMFWAAEVIIWYFFVLMFFRRSHACCVVHGVKVCI